MQKKYFKIVIVFFKIFCVKVFKIVLFRDNMKQNETFLGHLGQKGAENFSCEICDYLTCKKSHYELYKKLVDSEYDTMLVLEDDCKFMDFLKLESAD